MPRRARLDAPGTLHHIIVRGIERRQIVDDDRDRRDFVSRMAKDLVEQCGLSVTETGRHLGVSASAIAKSLSRSAKHKSC